MIRIDVTAFAELRAMVRGLKFIEREWLSVWTKDAKDELTPQWNQELEASRPSRLQRAVLVRTSRVAVSRRAIQLKAGSVGKLSSGAKPAALARAAEFGQDQGLRSKYRRKNPKRGTAVVTRHTAHPVGARVKTGKVVWPALERFVPRAAAVAAQKFYDVLKRIPGVD